MCICVSVSHTIVYRRSSFRLSRSIASLGQVVRLLALVISDAMMET